MASLKYDRTTRKAFIQFRDARRQRRGIRLSDVSGSFAERFHKVVERLNQARRTGGEVDNHTADFIRDLGDVFFDKLVKVDLVEPRQVESAEPIEEPDPEVCLGEFLDRYLTGRTDVKSGTMTFYRHTQRNLIAFFGQDTALADITEGDADDFRRFLKRQKLSDATINRRSGLAKTFFRAAVRHRLIAVNPFQDLQATSKANDKRKQFIDRETVARIAEMAPDAEWRLLIALARYGGLRMPSEALSLKWEDVDWNRNRIRVTSPKTEHHEGRDSREIPIFDELVQPLLDASEQSDGASPFVISRHRPAKVQDAAGHWRAVNLRSQFKKIIQRAGVTPWPRLWQNLRSSRETELAREHPLHVVCSWIGNTERIAAKHYLQVTQDDFDRATSRVMPPVMPHDAELGSMEQQSETRLAGESGSNSQWRNKKRLHAETCSRSLMGDTGFDAVSVTGLDQVSCDDARHLPVVSDATNDATSPGLVWLNCAWCKLPDDVKRAIINLAAKGLADRVSDHETASSLTAD